MHLPNITNLEGKVVVITGGAGILGEQFAYSLAQAKANVAILDLNIEKATQIADRIISKGQNAIAVKCNVLDKENIVMAKHEILKHYKKIDILINGAGGNHPKGSTNNELHINDNQNHQQTFFDLETEGVDFVFRLNFLGTLLPTQVFAEEMVTNGGNIINISSMSAYTPLTKVPAYSAAKAAISNFTQWLAVHFSRVNIRVNAIAPGFFLTKQNEALLLNSHKEYTERAKKIIEHTPMGRFGNGDELIGALLFLINDDAAGFINGVVLPVDGGFNAYSGV